MGIQFTGRQTIKFTNPINAIGLVSKTIYLRFNPLTSSIGTPIFRIYDGTGTDSDENILLYFNNEATKISFSAHFSTTNGLWQTTNNVLTSNNEYRICVTYDGGNVANNPLIYMNGVSVAVTRVTAPVGTYRNGTSADIYVGNNNGNPTNESDFTVEDCRLYTGIKTATQAANITNENIETNATIDESNLVFHAPLVMCKELTYSTFVGSTLGASNEFLDRMNGYVGVPTGSPVGA